MTSPKKKLLHVQGLRGMAIVSVVLFHFYPSFFPNGYLGVDQFFVISGYLMAMMMSRKEISPGSVLEFLYKRAKRILPLYLTVLLVITCFIPVLPGTAVSMNLDSAKSAYLLVSNVITNDHDYFEMLGMGVDAFTHTWSLALEMQFYLVFPLIFICYRYSGRFSLILTGIASIALYFHSTSSIRFNSMFCRIWQFVIGSLTFFAHFENQDMHEMGSEEKQSLRDVNLTPKHRNDLKNQAMGFTILIVIFLQASSVKYDSDFARFIATMSSALIILLGEGIYALENRALVELGEISYSWYLVHWPIYAFLVTLHLTSWLHYALALSLVLAIVMHFSLEKWLMKIGIVATISYVLIMYAISATLLISISPGRDLSSDMESLQPSNQSDLSFASYTNYTKEQVQKFNRRNDAINERDHFPKNCGYVSVGFQSARHCIKKGKGMPTLIVTGNSFAATVEPLIWEECQNYVSMQERVTISACEPLANNTVMNKIVCPELRKWLFDTIKRRKPDYVILIMRLMHLRVIEGGDGPLDDLVFKEAVSRLKTLEKHVKKKIYILDALVEIKEDSIKAIDDHFYNGAPLDVNNLLVMDDSYITAKMRMQRLEKLCPKCELFDYTSSFFINGTYRIYDPESGVRFFATSRHLSRPGVQRLRGVFRDICTKIKEN